MNECDREPQDCGGVEHVNNDLLAVKIQAHHQGDNDD